MSTAETDVHPTLDEVSVTNVDMKLEVVVIPVSDVDRARDFYVNLDWRVDADVHKGDFRLVQLTPPGSQCSVQFGTDITPAAPGAAQWVYLVVSDIKSAREDLVAHGVEVSEVFHEGPSETGSITMPGSPDRRPTTAATVRSLRSATPMATRGFSRRSRSGCPDALTPLQHASHRRLTWRTRFGERRRPTASMRNVSVTQTQTGPNGMPSTWSPNSPAPSSRRKRSMSPNEWRR